MVTKLVARGQFLIAILIGGPQDMCYIIHSYDVDIGEANKVLKSFKRFRIGIMYKLTCVAEISPWVVHLLMIYGPLRELLGILRLAASALSIGARAHRGIQISAVISRQK